MSRTPFLVLTVALVFALTISASNASLIGLNYGEIQPRSDLIVLGRVTGSTSLNFPGDISPYQLRHVSVQQYYKGDGPQTIDVKELGGEVGGGVSIWVEDQPELAVGKTYVLFLVEDGHGYYSVLGGPQGALSVEGGVARNFSYILTVTDSGLVPVKAEGVSVAGLQNSTMPIVNDPTDMLIQVGSVDKTGYWTFNVSFKGISGEAEGLSTQQAVSDFILGDGYNVLFSHNFTAPGSYSVEIDGTNLGQVEVRPPHSQVKLSWMHFSDSMFFVNQPITLRVGAIPANMTGEYRAITMVNPPTEGVEPFYWSYASYSYDSNWFTFHFSFREAGNYTVAVWQGGVRQITRSITVLPPPSSGGGSKGNPDASSVASAAAEVAAAAAEAAVSAHNENPGPAPPTYFAWGFTLTLAVLAFAAYALLKVVRK